MGETIGDFNGWANPLAPGVVDMSMADTMWVCLKIGYIPNEIAI